MSARLNSIRSAKLSRLSRPQIHDRPVDKAYFGAYGWLIALTCVLTAGMIDFGHYHLHHNADALVPVLVSLVRWTPFYWEQNYYGMLLPWLVSPIHHPLANLLAIQGLSIFSGLVLLFLLAHRMMPEGPWALVGSLSVTTLLWLAPHHYRHEILSTTQFFTVPMCLGLSAFALLSTRQTYRWAPWVALFCLSLACWVNIATPVILGVLSLSSLCMMRFGTPSTKVQIHQYPGFWELVFLLPSAVVGLFCKSLSPYRSLDSIKLQSLAEWFDSVWRMTAKPASVVFYAGSIDLGFFYGDSATNQKQWLSF